MKTNTRLWIGAVLGTTVILWGIFLTFNSRAPSELPAAAPMPESASERPTEPRAWREPAPSAPDTAGDPRLLAAAPVTAATPPIDPVPQLEILLRSPNPRVRMREIPPLDDAAATWLVGQYEEAEGITNKYRILRILSLAGRAEAYPLIANALTREFADVQVNHGESAMLGHLPELLGLVADQDDRALEFLVQGSRSEFWNGADVWQLEGQHHPGPNSLAAMCVKGLGYSTRVEAGAFLDGLRDDPARAVELNGSGAVVDAFFVREFVAEHGIEKVMDDFFFDPWEMMRQFSYWRGHTSNLRMGFGGISGDER
jgi:hypothetical protein